MKMDRSGTVHIRHCLTEFLADTGAGRALMAGDDPKRQPATGRAGI